MSWWQALVLGVLQGITEFLPVSSSGHLALVQMGFDRMGAQFSQPGVVFDAMLHVGTAAAVVWHERRQLVGWVSSSAGRRLLGLLVLGTLATAVTAFPLRAVATSTFERAMWVGVFLVITGVVVLATRLIPEGECGEEQTTWKQVVLVGLVQGLAVMPGISRSGTTITAGLLGGLDRIWAARFSFLLGVPAILGAAFVEMVGEREALGALGLGFWAPCVLGTVAAGLSGYWALRAVIRTLSTRVFHRFGWYCIPVGILVIALAAGGW